MSFLNLRKKNNGNPSPAAAKKPELKSAAPAEALPHVAAILRPHITEKASAQGAKGAYVFEVFASATKKTVREAVFALYKVRPVRVSIARIPRKKIVVKGKPGIRPGGKKAYVYLKEGDKIEVV